MSALAVEVVVCCDGLELARHALAPGEYLLGRAADCALRFDDEEVSAQHARLTLAGDGSATVEDLGSGQGTFLYDTPISGATPWPPSAPLRLGTTVLTYELAAEPPTVPASLYTPPSPPPLGPLDSAAARDAAAHPLQQQLHLTQRRAQRLDIGREVARGGMGAVRCAQESATRRTVAMKVMLRPDNPRDTARFISEARITARLEHPNIVPIYDLGIDEQGQPFYTMKMVEGITLARVLQLLKEGVAETVQRYPLTALLTIFQKLCDALAFAHARGVLHRDLKPANIMLGKYGEVLVMDWGLAKVLDNDEGRMTKDEKAAPTLGEGESRHSSSDIRHYDISTATMDGAILGTPQYMSPEQARGELDQLDARSDIFALGTILYEVLTLERAFRGRSGPEIISKVSDYDGSPLPAPEIRPKHLPDGLVPESLEAVVRKAMAPDKVQRYASVSDLQRDLEAFQNGFATSAENATLGRQIRLLVQRHKDVFGTLVVAWFIITSLGLWFIINLRVSEQTAMRNEKRAVEEKEVARRALAQSQVALADQAFRRADVAAMTFALQACPEDLRGQEWQYLWAKRDSSSGALKVAGFESPTCATEMPGHGGQFALANEHGDIGLADVATGQLWRTIKTGRGGIKLLAFSTDGHVLGVARNKPAQVELYDATTGARQKSLNLPGDLIIAFHLGRDASQLATILSAPNDRMDLLLVDPHTGATRWKRNGFFTTVLIYPEGDRLSVTGNSRAKHFTLLKTQDGAEISRLPVFGVSQALSPDAKTVAIGTQPGDLLLVDAVTGTEIQRGKLYAGALRELAWTADNRLITMGAEGKIRDGRWVLKLWDATDLSPMGMFFGLRSGAPTHWHFSPESGHLLTEENPPRRWHIPVGLEVAKIPQGSEIGWSGCFLSESVLLARKGLSFGRYDLSAPGKVAELSGFFPNSYCMAAVHWPSGQFALAKNINGEPFGFKIYAVQKSEVMERLSRAVNGRIQGLDFDSSGERLAAVFQGGNLLVYSAKTGEVELRVIGRYEHAVFAGGERNLVALNARTVKADEVANDLVLLDATGKTLVTVTTPYRVNALATSPGRAIVAIGGTDQTVHVYDAATLQERIAFRAHDGDIGALAFHPTAPIIASGSIDGSVKLWDYRSGRLVGYFVGLGGMPFALAFSPDGRLLMVDGYDKTTRVYDVGKVKAP